MPIRLLILIAALGAVLWAQRRPATPESVTTVDGKQLYETYCSSCHGADGRGNGPVAAGLRTPPPDLTEIARRAGGKFPTERVERIISGEEQSALAHGSREMPVWGPVFSRVEWDMDFVMVRLNNLARYLEGLQR